MKLTGLFGRSWAPAAGAADPAAVEAGAMCPQRADDGATRRARTPTMNTAAGAAAQLDHARFVAARGVRLGL